MEAQTNFGVDRRLEGFPALANREDLQLVDGVLCEALQLQQLCLTPRACAAQSAAAPTAAAAQSAAALRAVNEVHVVLLENCDGVHHRVHVLSCLNLGSHAAVAGYGVYWRRRALLLLLLLPRFTYLDFISKCCYLLTT